MECVRLFPLPARALRSAEQLRAERSQCTINFSSFLILFSFSILTWLLFFLFHLLLLHYKTTDFYSLFASSQQYIHANLQNSTTDKIQHQPDFAFVILHRMDSKPASLRAITCLLRRFKIEILTKQASSPLDDCLTSNLKFWDRNYCRAQGSEWTRLAWRETVSFRNSYESWCKL